jgi:hypothetical protein
MEIFIVKFKFIFLRKINLFIKFNLIICFLLIVLVQQNKLPNEDLRKSEKLIFSVNNYYKSSNELPSVEVNKIKFTPIIKDGNVYISVIDFINQINEVVFFLESKNKIIIANSDTTIEMWLNERGLLLNDEYVENEFVSFKKDEKIYVSLENIALYLGCKVNWDKISQNIIIEYKNTDNENLKFWHYNKTLLNYIKSSYKNDNKENEIKGIYIPQEDYYEVVTNLSKIDSNVYPDILSTDYQNLNLLINQKNIFENLDSFDMEEITSNMYNFILENGKDRDGNLKVISDFVNPLILLYRKDLAKEYLNLTSEDEIFEFIKDRNNIIKPNDFINKLKNDNIKIFINEYEYEAISDTKESREDFNNLVDFIKTNEIVSDDNYLSEGWNKKFENNESLFYYVPLWKVYKDIILNDEADIKEWGILNNKKHDIYGGIWYGITKESKNKNKAGEFIKFMTSDKEYLKENALINGEYPNSIDLSEILINYKDTKIEKQIFEMLNENLKK